MKLIKFVFFICLLVGITHPTFGIEPPGKIIDVSQFDAANQKKLNKANALIEKGNQFWKQANDMDNEIEMLKSEFRFGKAQKLEKKKERLLLQAANYYRDGHKSQYKVLEKTLQSNIKEQDSNEAREALMDGEGLYKKARKARLNAENRFSKEKTVDLIYEAVELENQALSVMERKFYAHGITIEPSPVMEKVISDVTPESDQVSFTEERIVPVIPAQPEVAATIAIPVETPPVIAPVAVVESPSALVPVIKEPEPEKKADPAPKESPKLFFSIQILADRSEASQAAISRVYSGDLPVIHMIGDGWHRYMVGRFKTLAEARQSMTSEGIKGFIVAYNGETRITVQEAVDLSKNH